MKTLIAFAGMLALPYLFFSLCFSLYYFDLAYFNVSAWIDGVRAFWAVVTSIIAIAWITIWADINL